MTAQHTPTGEQQRADDAFRTGENIVLTARAGTGKALRDDQPVLTPSGYKPISSLMPGDQVIGSAGQPVTVTGVYPQGVRPLFEVITSDGIVIVADADHRWLTETTQDRQRHRDQRWAVRTTAEIAATLTVKHSGRDRVNHYLPMLSAPVGGEDVDCGLDPWLTGVLIGDGNLSGSVTICKPDPILLTRLREVLPPGVSLVPQGAEDDGKSYRLSAGRAVKGQWGTSNPVVEALRDLGLMGAKSHEKQIPPRLMHASARQRHALLTGLLDTDGWAGGYQAEFSTTSPVLAEQVVWLVQSLGGTARSAIKGAPAYTHNGERRTGRPAWRIYISLPPGIAPFAHSLKASRYTPRSKYPPRRQIVAVRRVEDGPATCIAVDAPDQLFVTVGCVLTHNTTTLKMFGKTAAETYRRGIYVCFNSSVAKEAKGSFPGNVRCSTSHGLAFGPVGSRFRDRIDNNRRLPAREIAQILGITSPAKVGEMMLSPDQQARLVMEMVTRFTKSGDHDFVPWHTPRKPGLDGSPEVRRQLGLTLLPFARKAWADLTTPSGRLFYDQNCYLKLWQLSGPHLSGDFLLYDELQDANLCMLAVVLAQQDHMQLVGVGDEAQSINRWNMAVNGMVKFPATVRLPLSQSFRFGTQVAREANKWLAILGSDPPVRGYDRISSMLRPCPNADAVLCRTNAGAMAEAMKAMDGGHDVAIVGGSKDIRRLAEAAVTLKQGIGCEHPELVAFQTWGQLVDYVEQDPSGGDLAVFVQLIEDYGADVVLAMVDKLSDEKGADVVVSTVHKVKGREWDSVRIGGDFKEPAKDKNSPEQPPVPDDLAMLAYVAVTRAKLTLDRGSLAWVDNYLPGAVPVEPAAPEPVKAAAPHPQEAQEPSPALARAMSLALI